MGSTRSLVWLTALLLLLGCGKSAAPSGSAKTAAPSSSTVPAAAVLAPGEPETPLPVEADDARLGSETAEVTIVAFLDYECRHCREAFGVLMELRRRYQPEALRVVFKHLPLEGHPMGLPAAIAGQAVRDEAGAEAFFEFSRLAFDQQDSLSYVALAEWAAEVGVPRSVYNEAVSAESTLAQVARDAQLAWARGAEGTPTLFVNGRLLGGAPTLPELTQLVDQELARFRAQSGSWAERYRTIVAENAQASLATALLAEDPTDYLVPLDGSATRGPADALVTVVVFTDYQCPYCQRADATLNELVRRHPHDVRLVFKHLPLAFHQSARPAARLAEAVRRKGGDAAFFAVSHDLFALSPKLGASALKDLAGRHGLDTKTATVALSGDDQQLEQRIDRDLQLADDVEAAGTPHIFINGKRIAGARPLEHFEAVLLAEKQRAAERVAAGTAASEVYAALQQGASQPGAPAQVSAPPVTSDNPTRGPQNAAVTIHVFSDFECPFCRQAEETVLELERLYPGKVRFVWHDRPLDFHPLARPAARAGREARRQGGDAAFWKIHRRMFGLDQEKAAVLRSDLLAHAQALGLDVAAMEKAIDSPIHDAAIERDIALATSLGFQGTPAFVVGNYALTGARGLRHFQRLVDLSLAAPERAP